MRNGATWLAIGVFAFYAVALAYPSAADAKEHLVRNGYESIVIPQDIKRHFAACKKDYDPIFSFAAIRGGDLVYGTVCATTGKRIAVSVR